MAGLYNPPNKGEAFTFFLALRDMTTPGSFKANPTLASGDVKVSKDGGAFTNIDAGGTNVPSVLPASGVMVQVALTATEMTADNVVISFIDQTSPKEWADEAICIVTS